MNSAKKEHENKLSKTSAILSIYHLFRHCREVSYKEITDLLPIGQKTAQRHISLLKRAGLIQIRYSKKDEAFIPEGCEFLEPEFPEKESERAAMEQIIRLCTIMADMMENMSGDPAVRYRELFPDLTDRTQQEDFEELAKLGYKAWYVPADESPTGEAYWEYSDDIIFNTYSLLTFQEDQEKWK